MAKKNESTSNDDGTVFVRMVKGGEEIDVHPTCVAAHVAAGWVIAQ